MFQPSSFAGFNRDTFHLFRDLAEPEKNNRLWFDANRWRYEENVVGRFKALLQALKPWVRKLNPQFDCTGKTNGNFSRINRDIRFSKDKSPYKLNYYLYFFDQRRARDSDGRLYVGASGEGLTVGFSIYGEWRRKTGDVLETVLKKRLSKDGTLLRDYLGRRSMGRRYEGYWYSMKQKEWTQHRGLPKDSEDWDRLLAWVVRRRIKLRPACSESVLEEIQGIFKELYPLYVFSASSERDWRHTFKKFAK
ncbi:MAG: DUF2461 domain-containing protein [Acidobacteriia bacterium]|nr:DUF2461 domain-containing protein [Terriglobia bacterium]